MGNPATVTTPTTRSGSVKRETTPTATPLVPPTQKHPKPDGPTMGKRRPPATLRRRGGLARTSTPSHDLGCHEEITPEEEEEEEEGEEEGECSATQCLQPVTDQIIWVQCDHCQEWFHCVCVGLTKEYAEQIDTYKCASCKQPAVSVTPATAVGPPPISQPAAKVASFLSSFSPSISPGQT